MNYLALRLIRLRPGEEWVFNDVGNLCFVFPKEGAGTCAWGGGTHPLLPGDVCLLKSASDRKISISGEAGVMFQCFCARVDHLFPLFGAIEIGLLHAVVEGLKTIKHYAASNPLALECHKLLGEVPSQFGLEHRGQLVRLLAAIFSAEFKQEDMRPRGAMRPEQHFIRLFEELSITEITKCSIPDLARRFNCGQRQLNRVFHGYFGMSCTALRMELRLLRAASLLRDCGVKVIQVAEESGFNHLSLFNSCFKRRFGVSPGQYRKTISEASTLPGQEPSVNSSCRLQAIGLCPRSGDFDKANCTVERPSAANGSASSKHTSRSSRPLGHVLRSGDSPRPQPDKRVLELRIQV